MTIYDFALTPRRCERCRRRFIFERCDYSYQEVGIEHATIKVWYCHKCLQEAKPKLMYDAMRIDNTARLMPK